MERFDIRGSHWGLMEREDGLGVFTWAEEALSYRRSFIMAMVANAVVGVLCIVLASYIAFHKHDPQPVQTSAVTEGQYEDTLQEQRQLQAELTSAKRRISDLKALSEQLKTMVKTQNVTITKYAENLKSLSVSVPPQPVILEALRKEASTEEGLQAAVKRNFGSELAGRIRVME